MIFNLLGLTVGLGGCLWTSKDSPGQKSPTAEPQQKLPAPQRLLWVGSEGRGEEGPAFPQ